MNKQYILILISCLFGGCAVKSTAVNTISYPKACKTTVNHGKIDVYESINPDSLNMRSKVTFEATEYTDCPDEKNVVVITWDGENSEINLSLAERVVDKFFGHFYAGEAVKYFKINSENDENIAVYEFMRFSNAI